ncbi:cupin domain-containing protein [Chloroflexota bacterium]
MHISNLGRAEKKKLNMEGARGVQKQVPISKEDGTPNFSLRVFTIEPGGHTPHHTHPFEHLNYVIEGNGTVLGQDGEHEIKKGDFALILPDETHQYRNTSTTEFLVVICAVPKEYE